MRIRPSMVLSISAGLCILAGLSACLGRSGLPVEGSYSTVSESEWDEKRGIVRS